MKIVTTLLSAALIAGASTVAIAQSAGGSGGADSTLSPYDRGRGNDDNPTGMNADPMAGNRANTMQSQTGQGMTNGQGMNGMNSSDVSGQPMTNGQGMRGMNSSNVSGQWNDGSWNGSRSNRSGW
jgi:hypothetical protein